VIAASKESGVESREKVVGRQGRVSLCSNEERRGKTHQIEATRIMSDKPMAAPIPLPMLGAGSPVTDERKKGKRGEGSVSEG